MHIRLNFVFVVVCLVFSFGSIGCNDGPRQVKETSDYTFDDVAAMAAADSELSEVEE